jgi:acyl dehydratase
VTPTVFSELDTLLCAAPVDLGATDWSVVSPEALSGFEHAVGGAVSPYFALSLTNRFLPELLQVPAASNGVNYGAESTRFGASLMAGDRVRASASLVAAAAVDGGVQTTVEIRVEVDGSAEPACVVRSLSRWLG